MSTISEISRLLKGKIIIRHRNDEEIDGSDAVCMICNRHMTLPPGSVCMVVDDEGLLCSGCGEKYAPEMVRILNGNVPVTDDDSNEYGRNNRDGTAITSKELTALKQDLERLLEVTETLSRGVARGIVEAPAGHIGLMHYAKDIRKPPQKESETEKDYELRVRTFRITRLYEKIREDTTGRIERIERLITRLGLLG